MVSVVPRLAPGSTFAERFRIVSYVGQGSMGSVYRADPIAGGDSVALKITKLDAARDPRALKRFQREAESGVRLDSPYIARTLASGTLGDGGLAWIAMELVDGESLQELVERRAGLELASARVLLNQLFGALAVAHAAGIVHRDLKPENVRVASAGDALRLKVLDFGIAKWTWDGDSAEPSGEVESLSGTAPGLGTPLWSAPEQAREGYAPRPCADVWALGLLTFFALTGVPYWRHAAARASIGDLAVELLRSEIDPASERAAELGVERVLPAGFDAWFERAVQREPDARFRDASEAWRALEPLLTAVEPDVVNERRALVLPRPALFVTLVLLSCVAMGLTIYWLLDSARI